MRYTLTEGVSKMDTPFFIFSSSDQMSRIATPFMNIALFQGGSELERPFSFLRDSVRGLTLKSLLLPVTCYCRGRNAFVPPLCLRYASVVTPM